jgi:hypothetical protein
MLRGLLFGLVVFGTVGVAARAHATGDVFNLKKPAYLEAGSEWEYARKSDGTIWRRQVQAPGSWTSVGKPAPAAGATSGPEYGQMRIASNQIVHWIIVTSTDGIYGLQNGYGGSWVKIANLPPGGITSGPAVSFNTEMKSLHVVVRGAGNIPQTGSFTSPATGSGLVFNGWSQVGTMAIDSAPGAAETSWRQDVFGLVGENIFQTTCQYPSCFGSWSTSPLGATREAPSAYWMPGTTTDGPWLAVSVKGLDNNSWIRKYNNFTGLWDTTWTQKGTGPFDAAIAIGYMANTPQQGRLSTHGGSSYFFNPGGTGFLNIGSP